MDIEGKFQQFFYWFFFYFLIYLYEVCVKKIKEIIFDICMYFIDFLVKFMYKFICFVFVLFVWVVFFSFKRGEVVK